MKPLADARGSVVTDRTSTEPRASALGRQTIRYLSRQYLPHHASLHIGEAKVTAGITVGEALVIES